MVMKPSGLSLEVEEVELAERITPVKPTPTRSIKMNPMNIFAVKPGDGSPSLNKPAGKRMKPKIIMYPVMFSISWKEAVVALGSHGAAKRYGFPPGGLHGMCPKKYQAS